VAFPLKKNRNIIGQGAIVRSLRKPRPPKGKPVKACDCAPGETCPACAPAAKPF
jgi:hypothetical protein